MSNPIALTDEQQAVVAHTEGPALVFAVAGAGKTTAMVHRMAHMVESGQAEPRRILATSFGRANVQDLRLALRPFAKTKGIDIRTLHSLGRDIIRQAQQMGAGRHLRLNGHNQGEISPDQRLLSATIAEARKQNVVYKKELDGLDRQDFLDYVNHCKGNLLFANFAAANLPADAQKLAGQATDPSPQLTWYLDLYRLYEQVRLNQRVVTFADMLMTGWELLVRYPDLLTAVQNRYDHILVDEFQDVNLAQSEILDLLSQPHRNYMAIGDDDQTIYEWRGASPRYILDFPKRYNARTFVMRDNFRCPAAPLVLANQVIQHNKKRYEKSLQLTQGFRGETAVHHHKDIFQMAEDIVQRIRQRHKSGVPLSDMAVLVRLNAQTPPIEQALIAHNIPYRVSQPFYDRIEIKTLIQYGRLAWLEREVADGKRPLASPMSREIFGEAWRDISNRPKRYMNAEMRRRIWEQTMRQERPLSKIIQMMGETATYSWQQEPIEKLADDLSWLSKQLDKPAQKVLHQLDIRLDYQTWLRQSSGFRQTGEGRAISVSTFINYAQGQGTLTKFLQHIRYLAQQKIGQAHVDDMVTLSTIHQAKGLEWPIVFIPQCNQGFLPFISDRPVDSDTQAELLAEERRLFYVALTRTRRDCHLHLIKRDPLSQFLRESKQHEVLVDLPAIRLLLDKAPEKWLAEDVWLLVRATAVYNLHRYFEKWWHLAEKEAIVHTVLRFLHAAQHQNLWPQLDLTDEHLTFWQSLTEKQLDNLPVDFPDLKKLKRQPSRKNHQSPIVNRQSPTPEPDTILPGMWILTDAGWGQIEQILDLVKRPIPTIERTNNFARLIVTLRPQQEAEQIEIDISAEKIRFGKGKTLYACSQCRQFVSTDMNLVLKWHTKQAHDDVSPGFKQMRGTAVSLTTLRFAANYEPRLMIK